MKVLRKIRVTTDADEVYIITRYEDMTLTLERTHSSARSPKLLDDDITITTPSGPTLQADGTVTMAPVINGVYAFDTEPSTLWWWHDGHNQASGRVVTVEWLTPKPVHQRLTYA